jgi:hypothetical protein
MSNPERPSWAVTVTEGCCEAMYQPVGVWPDQPPGATVSIGIVKAPLSPELPSMSEIRNIIWFRAAESWPKGTALAVTVSTEVVPSLPVTPAPLHLLQILPPSVE